MNLAQVARLLGAFALFFTCVLVAPLIVALVEADNSFHAVRGFVIAIAVGMLVGGGLRLAGRTAPPEFYRREGLAVVGFAWLLAGVLGATPLVVSSALTSPADAFFESVSGLTTTGATVFGGANPTIESLPPSLLLWRSLLQWVGGIGIVLAFTILLPAMGLTGKNLLDSEQVGVKSEEQRPHMREQSRMLFRLYIVLTLAALIAFRITGVPWFESMCHAMTTMATGGFSTENASIGAYRSVATELVAVFFMFLAGCKFALLLSVSRDHFRLSRLYRDPEFRTYVALTLGLIVFVTLCLRFWGRSIADAQLDGVVRDYSSLLDCLRDSTFQVVSILTSTGYGNTDFQNWPKAALFALVFCMLIGGCTGSTAGGLKVLRLVVCGKLVAFTLRLFVRPNLVQKLRVGSDIVPNSVTSAIVTMLILWLCSIGVGTLVLELDTRLDAVSALTASTSMLGCTGPAITEVVHAANGTFEVANASQIDLGPYGGYAPLHWWAKVYLAFQMMLGRLEILVPLVLLAPGFWRK